MLHKSAQTVLRTQWGVFRFMVFREEKGALRGGLNKYLSLAKKNQEGKEHVALVKDWGKNVPLVRIHSECMTGDLFGSVYCDCQGQLHEALRKVQGEGGIILYLRQEGRGLGLTNKILAYELQRKGKDTVQANLELGRGEDERTYELAVDMLRQLGVKRLRLLTNNPAKVQALEAEGFEVERVGHVVEMKSQRAKKYLEVKRKKMGHILDKR